MKRTTKKVKLLLPNSYAILNPARKSPYLRRIAEVHLHFKSKSGDCMKSLLACGHSFISGEGPEVGDLALCEDCRRDARSQRAFELREAKRKREAKELKWVTVTIGLNRELWEELHWTLRRDRACGDRATFKDLIVHGLYLVRDEDREAGRIIGEFREQAEEIQKTRAAGKPPDTVQ